MKKFGFPLGLVALMSVAACVPSGMFETEAVRVPTRQGIVTCQLYSTDITWWDHAISRPQSMSVQMADDICFETGRRVADSR